MRTTPGNRVLGSELSLLSKKGHGRRESRSANIRDRLRAGPVMRGLHRGVNPNYLLPRGCEAKTRRASGRLTVP